MRKYRKYRVFGYDSVRNDFVLDFGEHEDLDVAIQIACDHANAIVEAYDLDEDWDIHNLHIAYRAFDSEESELFFKRNFPKLF